VSLLGESGESLDSFFQIAELNPLSVKKNFLLCVLIQVDVNSLDLGNPYFKKQRFTKNEILSNVSRQVGDIGQNSIFGKSSFL